MQTKISGRVWKYGDDVNTDVIFPGKYTYSLTDPQEMAAHALEDLDPDFATRVQPGDIIEVGDTRLRFLPLLVSDNAEHKKTTKISKTPRGAREGRADATKPRTFAVGKTISKKEQE